MPTSCDPALVSGLLSEDPADHSDQGGNRKADAEQERYHQSTDCYRDVRATARVEEHIPHSVERAALHVANVSPARHRQTRQEM